MTPTGLTETFVYQAITGGQFQIRQDGSIWRVAQRRANRWNKKSTLHPVKPHRVDNTICGGYRLVKVMLHLKQVTVGAHRLVWLHFRGPIPAHLTVNHKNGIKSDNRPDNLELATYSEQTRHMLDVLKKGRVLNQYGEKNAMVKLSNEQVQSIRQEYANSATLTQTTIAHKYGVTFQAISKIVRGEGRKNQSGPTANYISRRKHPVRRNSLGRFR